MGLFREARAGPNGSAYRSELDSSAGDVGGFDPCGGCHNDRVERGRLGTHVHRVCVGHRDPGAPRSRVGLVPLRLVQVRGWNAGVPTGPDPRAR